MEVINTAEFGGVERSTDSASPKVAPRFLDSNKKLGMWLFVVSDGLTFAVLLAGYVYLRFSSVAWPTPFEFYPGLVLASLMTVALLSSGLAMAAAVNSFSRGNLSRARTLIVAAIAGGGLFLAIHGYEWSRLIGEGLTPLSLPQAWRAQWPQSSLGFGSTFYTITGLHMLH